MSSLLRRPLAARRQTIAGLPTEAPPPDSNGESCPRRDPPPDHGGSDTVRGRIGREIAWHGPRCPAGQAVMAPSSIVIWQQNPSQRTCGLRRICRPFSGLLAPERVSSLANRSCRDVALSAGRIARTPLPGVAHAPAPRGPAAAGYRSCLPPYTETAQENRVAAAACGVSPCGGDPNGAEYRQCRDPAGTCRGTAEREP
jgi:hypothetical protein